MARGAISTRFVRKLVASQMRCGASAERRLAAKNMGSCRKARKNKTKYPSRVQASTIEEAKP